MSVQVCYIVTNATELRYTEESLKFWVAVPLKLSTSSTPGGQPQNTVGVMKCHTDKIC